ncbi:MAG: hypothetical protein ACLR7Z_19135 [Bilophila wadsworthia]
MPSQFLTACVLRQFVAAFVGEVQELYDAVLDMQRGRTSTPPKPQILTRLGASSERNAPRTSTVTRTGSPLTAWGRLGFDAVVVPGRPAGRVHPEKDPVYRTNILARVIANHTLVASVPELEG